MLSFIFPDFCCVCHRPGAWMCDGCDAGMRLDHDHACSRCGTPFLATVPSHLCGECLMDPPVYDWHRSLFKMTLKSRQLVHDLKYRNQFYLLNHFAEKIVSLVKDKPINLILPVPLHKKRLRARGFNQSWEIAKLVASKMRVLSRSDLLLRIRDTKSQTTLDKNKRLENLHGAFALEKSCELSDKHVLLIDDVYTTGSTLQLCAKELKRAGVASLSAATLVRVV